MTTPVPLTSVPAKKWIVEVDTSATTTPTWVQVRGVTDVQPALNTTTQDDSDYDSGNWGSDAKTQIKWSLVLKLSRKRAAGYAEDPGQKALRLASDQVGTAGSVHVRWFDRFETAADGEAYSGYAMVQWSDDGGNTQALSTTSVTLMGQGERTVVTTPVTP